MPDAVVTQVLISHKTFCEVTKYSGGHEPFAFRKYKDVSKMRKII